MAVNDYNRCYLEGRFVKTPELHYTKANMAIAHATLVTNKYFVTKDGQEHEESMFTDLDIFGKLAELAGTKLNKGTKVIAEGHLKQDVWENDGKKYSKHVFVVERFVHIEFPKSRNGNNNSYPDYD